MSFFSSLFTFSKREINDFFSQCKAKHAVRGLKLLAISLDHSEDKQGKLLIVVPKTFGSAPLRNRIRRQLKNIYFTQKLYEAPYRAAIIVYPEARGFSFEGLKHFLITALS